MPLFRHLPDDRNRSHSGRTATPLLLAGLAIVFVGCRLDIVRVRDGNPIDEVTYEGLKVEQTTLDESLEKLGAPVRVAHKAGSEEDYLWYEYLDEIDVGLRFRLPIPIGFYQHNVLTVQEFSDQRNKLQLVFDDEGVLQSKSIFVSEAYQEFDENTAPWKLHLMPRFAHSFYLVGDGGLSNYEDMFDNGYRAGMDLGFQPVPVFMLLLGGSFSQYQGRNERIDTSIVAYDDLEMFDIHIGVRMSAPLEIFAHFDDYEYLKKILFDENLERARGFQVYLQGTTGATFSNNVTVAVNGQRRGNFYDSALLSSSTVDMGFEYAWEWGMAYAGLTYHTIDAFDEGSSGLNDSADSFQSLMVTGGVTIRF